MPDQNSPIKAPPSTPNNDTAMATLSAAGGFLSQPKFSLTNAGDVVQKMPTASNPAQMQYPKSAAPTAKQTKTFPSAPTPTFATAGWSQIGALVIPQASRVQKRA